MASENKCLECGKDIPADAPGGHCLHCLAQLALDPDEGDVTEELITVEVSAENQAHKAYLDQIGCYTIVQQLGEGGCGIVYMADQAKPIRRRVALKVIKPGMDWG